MLAAAGFEHKRTFHLASLIKQRHGYVFNQALNGTERTAAADRKISVGGRGQPALKFFGWFKEKIAVCKVSDYSVTWFVRVHFNLHSLSNIEF